MWKRCRTCASKSAQHLTCIAPSLFSIIRPNMKLKSSWVPPLHKASINMRLCQLFRGRSKRSLHDSKVNNFKLNISLLKASLMAQTVKNLPAMWETWVWSLGWEDSLEERMATHSIILAWRILKDRGAQQAAVQGVTESDTTEQLRMHACFLNFFWSP